MQRFEKTWLMEMPFSMIGTKFSPFDGTVDLIRNYIQKGSKPQDLGNGLWKIVISSGVTHYYWMEENKKPTIALSMTKFGDRYAIESVGKAPGSKVHASDFYWQILDHLPGGMLLSDDMMTKDGIRLWKRFLTQGLNIMVYNPADTKGYESINSLEELEKYFGKEYEDHRFVLSKDKAIHESVVSQFQLLRAYNLGNNIKE